MAKDTVTTKTTKTAKKTVKKAVKKVAKKAVKKVAKKDIKEAPKQEVAKPKLSPGQPVDHPQPTSSSPESPEPKVPEAEPESVLDPVGEEVVRLSDAIREYCNASGAVDIILKRMCDGCPEAFPNYRNWVTAKMGYDISVIVAGKMQAVGWVERLLPTLFVMLQDHIFNIRWTAQVAIALTVSVTSIELPMLLPIEVQRLITKQMVELLHNNIEVRERMASDEPDETPNIILPRG